MSPKETGNSDDPRHPPLPPSNPGARRQRGDARSRYSEKTRSGHAALGAGRAWLTESATRYPMFSAGILLLVMFGLVMMLERGSKFAT